MQSKFTQYAVYTMIFLILLFCGLSASAYAATEATPSTDASGGGEEQLGTGWTPVAAESFVLHPSLECTP